MLLNHNLMIPVQYLVIKEIFILPAIGVLTICGKYYFLQDIIRRQW